MDFRSGLVCNLQQFIFPQLNLGSVAAAAARIDIYSLRIRKSVFADTVPPPQNALSSEFCSAMICYKIDDTGIVIQYIYLVRRNFTKLWNGKIMIQNRSWIFLFLVFTACVFEVDNMLFFLCVNADYRVSGIQKLLCFFID